MRLSILATVGFFILALATAPSAVHAQATTGTISGAVTDESKAVLPGVTIVVRNMETGATRQLVTDERGGFRAMIETIPHQRRRVFHRRLGPVISGFIDWIVGRDFGELVIDQ